MTPEALLQLFNYAESGLWLLIAAVFAASLIFGRVRPPFRKMALLMTVALTVFGISDLFEVASGAWWEPWWLCAVKTACVLTFIGCGIAYWRHRR